MTSSLVAADILSTDIATASAGYLGWSGRQNLGDDVLYEVIATALPDVRLARLPMSPPEILQRGLRGIRHRHGRPLVLGGGTAVGRMNWRAALHAAGVSCGAEHHLIGVGVEDPRFRGRHSFSTGGELQRWRRPLNRFHRVTVRGPQSARLLSDIGVDAEVVGDPALLLHPDGIRNGSVGAALGISLGYGDDLWGHDHTPVTDAVARLAADRARAGQPIAFLVVNPRDEAHLPAVTADLPDGSYRVERPRTAAAFLSAAEGCQVIVAERLHAGILAVAAGIPTVMLEYQPKVRDFMESVHLGALCVRVDQLDAGNLAALAHEAVINTALRADAALQVQDLRTRLSQELDLLSDSIRHRCRVGTARVGR